MGRQRHDRPLLARTAGTVRRTAALRHLADPSDAADDRALARRPRYAPQRSGQSGRNRDARRERLCGPDRGNRGLRQHRIRIAMPCNERHPAGRRRRNRSETDARGAVDSGPDRRGTEACESGPGADSHGSLHARRGATGPRRRLRGTGRRPAPRRSARSVRVRSAAPLFGHRPPDPRSGTPRMRWMSYAAMPARSSACTSCGAT